MCGQDHGRDRAELKPYGAHVSQTTTRAWDKPTGALAGRSYLPPNYRGLTPPCRYFPAYVDKRLVLHIVICDSHADALQECRERMRLQAESGRSTVRPCGSGECVVQCIGSPYPQRPCGSMKLESGPGCVANLTPANVILQLKARSRGSRRPAVARCVSRLKASPNFVMAEAGMLFLPTT
jgi:hypothetical protein